MLKRSLALLTLLLAFPPQHASAQLLSGLLGGGSSPPPSTSTWSSNRVDSEVQRAVRAGKKTRVIITFKPGARNRMAAFANYTGTRYRGESRNTITLELPASIVKLVSQHADALGISIDAPIKTNQLLGGLLGNECSTSQYPTNPCQESSEYDA